MLGAPCMCVCVCVSVCACGGRCDSLSCSSRQWSAHEAAPHPLRSPRHVCVLQHETCRCQANHAAPTTCAAAAARVPAAAAASSRRPPAAAPPSSASPLRATAPHLLASAAADPAGVVAYVLCAVVAGSERASVDALVRMVRARKLAAREVDCTLQPDCTLLLCAVVGLVVDSVKANGLAVGPVGEAERALSEPVLAGCRMRTGQDADWA